MFYGQLIIGPAGSGKSTFCKVMSESQSLLRRRVHVINLDPSNDALLYTPLVDLTDIISTEDVVDELALGPNGGLVYALDYLVDNFDIFQEMLEESVREGDYVLFDCPGQLELYTHLDMFTRFIAKMTNEAGFILGSVYVMDVTVLGDYHKYVSGLLMGTVSMLQLGLPHATVLNKMDLLEEEGLVDELQERFYMESSLPRSEESGRLDSKLKRMTGVLRDIVMEHDLVSV